MNAKLFNTVESRDDLNAGKQEQAISELDATASKLEYALSYAERNFSI